MLIFLRRLPIPPKELQTQDRLDCVAGRTVDQMPTDQSLDHASMLGAFTYPGYSFGLTGGGR
jgi:hypothetical protein